MFGKHRPAIAQRTEYPRLPEGERIYAIGDIHGRTDLLDRAHAAIDADMATTTDRATEVYLGDFVDRGPDSAGVIERLLRRAQRGNVVAIRGNHEVIFEDFLAGELDPEKLRQVGGLETLLSYGVDVRGLAHAPRERWAAAAQVAVPSSHRAFLAGLADCFVAGEYYFTHAGVRPGVPLDAQDPDDLQWVRDVFLSDERDHGAVIVHGHTPTIQPEFLPNRINLDTGAYLTGRLTCVAFDSVGPRLLAV